MANYDDFPAAESYGSGSFPGHRYSVSYSELDSSLSDDGPPRILLMGPRRSGKSSIQKVVFHKMSPHETLFLEPTSEVRIKDINNNALVQFQILDFPGGYQLDEADTKAKLHPSVLFKRTGALVYVIDGQDDDRYTASVDGFIQIAKIAFKINPKICFDVLIHKMDGDSYVSDDHKMDCQRDIQQQITDELADAKLPIHPSYYITSIYDHTIFEAFSKIAQKLITPLAYLENLLDSLISSCGIEKAFLFDVVSKIYVATDSNPVDVQTYELCSDMIDVVIDVSCIYGLKNKGDALAYDSDSASVINLSNNYILYLREVNKYLALVCLMRSDSFEKSGLVEYNIAQFRAGIATLFEQNKSGGGKASHAVGSSSISSAAAGSALSSVSNGNGNVNGVKRK